MENAVLQGLIKECLGNKRQHQKKLYKAFYGFAYSIALRYASDIEEASIIMNKGFYLAFVYLKDYKEPTCFKEWLRHLMVQASIEYYNLKKKPSIMISESTTGDINSGSYNLENGFSYYNAIKMLHQLPASFRIVFNLFAIEGYVHEQIAGLLGISVYNSESLLTSARRELGSLMNAQNRDILRLPP